MKQECSSYSCSDRQGQIVCHCLQVSEDRVVEAITALSLTSLREICRYTGAGEGCTACHCRLKEYLELHSYASSPPDICSVK